MNKHPKSIEELLETHGGFIKEWIKHNNSALQDTDEFISSFYQKVISKKILLKFDSDRGWKFETWLNRVLKNHYYDQINISLKDNWDSIDTEAENSRVQHKDLIADGELNQLDTIIKKDAIDFLINLINKIDVDRDRILIKLKIYQKGQDHLIVINNQDLDYIKSINNLNHSEIVKFIDENAKETFGLKDKDICQLLDLSPGSINTFYQRAVRKWLNV